MKKIAYIENTKLRRFMICIAWILTPLIVIFANLFPAITKYFEGVFEDYDYLIKATKKHWRENENRKA